MREYKLIIPAGEMVQIAAVGDYVRVKSSGVAGVKVMIESPDCGELLNMDAGDAVILSAFGRLNVSHDNVGIQTIVLLIGNGTRAESSTVHQLLGSISVQASGAMTSTQKTVTNASSSLVADNPLRRFLAIQNNGAGSVFVNVAGVAATLVNSLKIGPGASLMFDAFTPTGQVFAIGDIASNTAVVVVEG